MGLPVLSLLDIATVVGTGGTAVVRTLEQGARAVLMAPDVGAVAEAAVPGERLETQAQPLVALLRLALKLLAEQPV